MQPHRKFLEPQTLAKLQGLQLRARQIVEGYVSGMHRSPYHGFSIEFAEHREYAPGDDLRYLDWKVFGRTDKFYLKQFEDETNLIAYFVVDASESMTYRSAEAPLSKLEYAQCIAASLAWLVLQQQDAVSLVTFDDAVRTILRPSSSAAQIKQVIQVLEGVQPQRKTAAGRIFHDLAERFSKRGVVLILSDLLDDGDALLAGLKHFRHRRHDVIVMHLLDPAELDFPFRRPTLFRGLEGLPDVLTDPRSLRKAYLAEMQRFCETIRRGCLGFEMDYQRVRTDQNLDLVLTSYLAARAARVK